MRNVKEVELGDQILNEIKGKTINKPLYDEAGIIIIKPGQTIDDEVIKKALEIGKLHDLLKLAAAKDVEDEIIEIKKIEE